jgi:hypothetical protein
MHLLKRIGMGLAFLGVPLKEWRDRHCVVLPFSFAPIFPSGVPRAQNRDIRMSM